MKRNPILDIINDDVIIFAHRKKLAKQGVTPLHKLNDSTVSFLLFLEAHNALLDFIDTFKDYNTDKHKSIAFLNHLVNVVKINLPGFLSDFVTMLIHTRLKSNNFAKLPLISCPNIGQ